MLFLVAYCLLIDLDSYLWLWLHPGFSCGTIAGGI